MTWCSHCTKDCLAERDPSSGSVCCSECGKVITQDVFTEEATFVKDATGASRLAGNIIRNYSSDYSDSHQRTLERGNSVIFDLIDRFGITDVSHCIKYYQIAVERGFTKGRRFNQVAAACLYVGCREKEKSFLLIDFSSQLNISVYELGAVYLQLCKLLSLEEHEFIQKPVDPSLFMHRFTNSLNPLIKDDSKSVLKTALQFVASMKRDWMQTGRKPSGICGAALFISALTHGYKVPKSEIVKVVHICEATLTKRLIEFENTKSGSLTINEFTERAEEFEEELRSCKQSDINSQDADMNKVLCEHTNNVIQSGYGLCQTCYLFFCGGLEGSDPPAFDRVAAEASAEMAIENSPVSAPSQDKSNNEEIDRALEDNPPVNENEKGDLLESHHASSKFVNPDASETSKDVPAVDETDTLSEIDDAEVNSYLNNEEESRYKRIIWEEVNKEYIQEQAAKAAAARESGGDGVLAAYKQTYSQAQKEKRKQKKALEARNAKVPRTAAEATRQALMKKGQSGGLNFDKLEELLGDDPEPKKARTEDDHGSKNSDKGAGNKDEIHRQEDEDFYYRGDDWNDDGQEMYDHHYDDNNYGYDDDY